MEYKKIIKSRALRIKILQMLSFVPDTWMLKLQYRLSMGRKLNLKDPVRFTEKLQWYKLYYRNPLMTRCVDKYEVRQYLREQGCGDLLAEDYGVYASPEEIDLSALPDAFVLKDTLGGGGNSVILVKDKSAVDWEQIKKEMAGWCAQPIKKDGGREWPYYTGKAHRILVEAYMDEPGGLREYKFFCFQGRTEFLYCISDRVLGQGGKFHIMNRDFQKLDVVRIGDEPGDSPAVKPKSFDRMREKAEQLAAAFPHVRVDMYEHRGEIRFGELTFYNASGYMKYDPDSFDVEMGKKFILTTYGK